MTTTPRQHQPGPPSAARQHLAAIAASLTSRGLDSHVSDLGGTPVLTIGQPAEGTDPAVVAIDPDPGAGPGLRLECTCTWTPAPGDTPDATAGTVLAVLAALRPAPAASRPS
jgi:hypothetical protein